MRGFGTVVSLFIGLAVAQDLSAIQGLPDCGVSIPSVLPPGIEFPLLTSPQKTCINNMLGKAQSLGCQQSNLTCLCTNMNFGYGVRDCSTDYCPKGQDTSQIIQVGNSFCQSKHQSVNPVSSE